MSEDKVEQKVTVGRTVHYVTVAGENLVHYAAIVTAVGTSSPNFVNPASLFVMTPYGTQRIDTAGYSEIPKLGTWHWPERG